jgi:hypothetical protein
MDYASLEDAYGSAFGQRVPITQQKAADAIAPRETSKSIEQRGAESSEKHKDLIAAVKKTIGYDTAPETVTYTPPPHRQQRVQEHFASSQPANVILDTNQQSETLSRILRLVEQNKTGYERPAVQDMVLYIATGIFFLFTFDTFVVLGKTMRGGR